MALFSRVYSSNLWRRFTVAEHAGYTRHMTGRVKGWDPKTFPTNVEDAKKLMDALPGYIISKNEFDAYLGGTWPVSVPRPKVPLLATTLRNKLNGSQVSVGPEWGDVLGKPLLSEQKKLIDDMKRYFSSKHVPVRVVYLASREELLKKPVPSDFETVVEFAKLMNAKLIDGRKAFEGLTDQEVIERFFPVDGHWNQKGSNHFADFMANELL
jgi:hypothetical protein